ncbi:Spo0E like sporulation regulatory protein [Paenibacillus tianmuensis]|uniref:Spo0E like sporulation regulatory protein n=1 Tax=Paenibacillus tianmuensis TaxID=624147 RepID=A0A1G4S193_9BACL|nr:Spo0E family sporulation regulatory protein-aspartic acid phosphatase [Paenibacillus tianmuensis]SCW63003.1 Spo0E like sporulation regulatory protein [Paenibacillus tianmuensis]
MTMLANRKEACATLGLDHLDDGALHNSMKNIQSQMEEAVRQGASLTSEYIVQLSQQLDGYVVIAQTRKMRLNR